ncbi:chloride channel protein [Deminuibacter soli]|uniref:Chloride channel protein n=1 Tax=Deminuibacter soli TaxID=2291815 RepID=A0A3E1NE92_9BACT|nr:chloride channel protein [Deminuibacter soli]RFM26293.1 chloride channel protein [Deminuibacter soli]
MNTEQEFIPISPSLTGMPVRPGSTAGTAPVNKRVVYLCLQAILNAVIIGFVARGLVYLIDFITQLAFYHRFSFAPASPAGNRLGLLVIGVPITGSLIVGLMARYGSKAIRGHGIPEAMEKIMIDNSKIPWGMTFLKPLSAAVSIGTGGPFGAEGPIIATGGALGSVAGQLMHISAAERKIMLAAGSCAGMSAIFGSPLAAVLLAIELLLFEFSPRSIIPVTLACVTGAGMHLLLFESHPVFEMPAIPVASGSALIAYVAGGLLIGVAAAFITKAVYGVEDLFEKLPIHFMWWPAIGAVAVGVVGYFAPYTMGVGYSNISHLLEGNAPLQLILSLCVLKFISWVIALGSGTSGGTLAPLFTIGGALGAALGILGQHLFPDAGINIPTAALIGMAAMFAGASRAVLTSIVFALETTGQSNGLLPLLGACAAAYAVSFFLMKGSIMTEKIIRRGVKTPDAYEPDVLQGASVQQLYHAAPGSTVHNAPAVLLNDNAATAAELMGRFGISKLAVVKDADSMQYTGYITSADILKYYGDSRYQSAHFESPRITRRWMVRGRRLVRRSVKQQ